MMTLIFSCCNYKINNGGRQEGLLIRNIATYKWKVHNGKLKSSLLS